MENQNTKPEKIKLEKVQKVAKTVSIEEVKLLSFSGYGLHTLPNGGLEIKFAYSTETRAEEQKIFVLAQLSVSGFVAEEKEEKDSKPCMKIEADYVIVYESEKADTFSEEELEAFGEFNGVYNIYPYWREFIQNSVARMGLPPLMLPTLRWNF